MLLFYYCIKLHVQSQRYKKRLNTQMAEKLKSSNWLEGKRERERLYCSRCSCIYFFLMHVYLKFKYGIYVYIYIIYIYKHAHTHTLIFDKQTGQGIGTQRCRLTPLFVLNFFTLHHLDLPYVVGGLIEKQITWSLTLFNLTSCNVFLLAVPEIHGGVKDLNLSNLLMGNEK